MQTDVLIVGAGPTGLMLANQLARRAIKPMVIDRHSGPGPANSRHGGSRARPRNLRQDGTGGCGAEARRARNRCQHVGQRTLERTYSDRRYRTWRQPVSLRADIQTGDNERLLRQEPGAARCRDLPGRRNSCRSCKSRRTSRPSSGSRAARRPRSRQPGSPDATGARSAVRRDLRDRLPGEPYEHTFFVADTEAVGPVDPASSNVYLWRDGFHLFFPMRGQDRWRVIGILPRGASPKGGDVVR